MSLQVYCSQDDVEFLWSEFGVEVRLDDEDATSDAAYMAAALQKATADVNLYLLPIHSVSQLASSTWVRWCTALHAAMDLARRRGNDAPDSFQAEWQRYHDALVAIAAGQMMVPGETGPLATLNDSLPMVTNLRVDSRFPSTIRRVTQSSTRSAQSPTRKGYDLPYGIPFWW